MSGRVFISCGQGSEMERSAAENVSNLIRNIFGLDPYLAFRVQGLNDIMKIISELSSCDYYIFIDFVRKNTYGISIFTHQELALAYHIGYENNIIALRQEEAPEPQGFLRYLQVNPVVFTDESDLLIKVERLIRERCWCRNYSRNLVVKELGFSRIVQYTDHRGSYLETTYIARVENRRPDVAAIQSVCILDKIQNRDNVWVDSPDRSYLKWAGQTGYDRTILPKDHGDIDLFSIHINERGIFLHSLRDLPREPIRSENGQYIFRYKLFSRGFQLVEFDVEIELKWQEPRQFEWLNTSIANLIN